MSVTSEEDPIELFKSWFADAKDSEPEYPTP